MTLYRVHISLDMVVEADTPEDAAIEARDNVSESLTGADASFPREICTLKDVPDGWLGCIPWGSPDEKTVREKLKNKETK